MPRPPRGTDGVAGVRAPAGLKRRGLRAESPRRCLSPTSTVRRYLRAIATQIPELTVGGLVALICPCRDVFDLATRK